MVACSGVGLLYRESLADAFSGVEGSVSALRARFGGRQRSTLYQVPLSAPAYSLHRTSVSAHHNLARSSLALWKPVSAWALLALWQPVLLGFCCGQRPPSAHAVSRAAGPGCAGP